MRTLTLLALTLLPAAAIAGESTGPIHHGAAFTLKTPAINLEDIAAAPDSFAGKTILVEGQVATVCKKKGCWLGIKGQKGALARVKFKDYAFFAPTDCEGQQATLEGTVTVTKLDDKERAHLAEDAGKKMEDIPAVELQILANGLALAAAAPALSIMPAVVAPALKK